MTLLGRGPRPSFLKNVDVVGYDIWNILGNAKNEERVFRTRRLKSSHKTCRDSAGEILHFLPKIVQSFPHASIIYHTPHISLALSMGCSVKLFVLVDTKSHTTQIDNLLQLSQPRWWAYFFEISWKLIIVNVFFFTTNQNN